MKNIVRCVDVCVGVNVVVFFFVICQLLFCKIMLFTLIFDIDTDIVIDIDNDYLSI